jgi:hypothetical protein
VERESKDLAIHHHSQIRALDISEPFCSGSLTKHLSGGEKGLALLKSFFHDYVSGEERAAHWMLVQEASVSWQVQL